MDNLRDRTISALSWSGAGQVVKQLFEFMNKSGHTNVSTLDTTNSKLGRCVSKQRDLKKKNKFNPEREQKLESIGFVWRLRK